MVYEGPHNNAREAGAFLASNIETTFNTFKKYRRTYSFVHCSSSKTARPVSVSDSQNWRKWEKILPCSIYLFKNCFLICNPLSCVDHRDFDGTTSAERKEYFLHSTISDQHLWHDQHGI